MELLRPRPFEVFQRTSAASGPVSLAVAGEFDRVEVQISAVPEGGRVLAKTVPLQRGGGQSTGTVEVPAGGWYALTVTAGDGSSVTTSPFGVGEVFLVAGQSYGGNANDARTTIDDVFGRVASYDVARESWQVAHDPQPQGGGHQTRVNRLSAWGSVWPAAMNLLLPAIGVPIAVVTGVVFSEPLHVWLEQDQKTAGPLHAIETAARATAGFRAFLWAHGESDVINRTSRDDYLARFREVRRRVATRLGGDHAWIIARSTHHPTVYNDPRSENEIRLALGDAARDPLSFVGPDTDLLRGLCRAPVGRSQHLSAAGQKAAGALWFTTLLTHLSEQLRG